MATALYRSKRTPWNKEKLVSQKKSLKLREIWTIRIRLQIAQSHHELALFNLAIDSNLRACDCERSSTWLGNSVSCHDHSAKDEHTSPVRTYGTDKAINPALDKTAM